MPQKDQFSNKNISKLLKNVAIVYSLVGDPETGESKVSHFRIIAFQKAAESVERLSREIYDIWKDGKLYKIPGIGSGIGSSLEQYFETGKSEYFDLVLNSVPKSLFVLMDIPGIGPKKALKLIMNFGIVDEKSAINDLLKIATEKKIENLEGFGKKSQTDIIKGIELYKNQDKREDRMPISYAINIAENIADYISEEAEVVEILGSLRRRAPTIGDIDIAVIPKPQKAKKIIKLFTSYPGVRSIEAMGENKASIIVSGNVRVDLRTQERESFGSMLQYFTGSKSHNIALRELALKKGYSLSEYGLRRKSDSKLLKFENEEDLYNTLGLQYIPPEIREGTEEIELAKKKKLPDLITLEDIKGDFHIHSSYDISTSHDLGANSYEEIVQKAAELNYKYIGFSDHNPKQNGISYENKLSILKNRKHYIDQVLSSAKIKYYIGLEVDILPSGEIAFPDDGYDFVDYLIVSVHSSFNMSREEMTKRVLKALSFPKVRIFGHPTARLLGKRKGIELDWDRVFDFMKKNNIAAEINSAPSRLDLPDSLVREGKNYGIKFFIDTDAHAVSGMDFMKYGVYVARRGFLEARDVINTWEDAKLEKWLTDNK